MMPDTLYPHEWLWQNKVPLFVAAIIAGVIVQLMFILSFAIGIINIDPIILSSDSLSNAPVYYGSSCGSPYPMILIICCIMAAAYLIWRDP